MYVYSQLGWRLGLQAATGLLLSTFFLGTLYRSASLYHPQRRAILHLKTQRKKVRRLLSSYIFMHNLMSMVLRDARIAHNNAHEFLLLLSGQSQRETEQ